MGFFDKFKGALKKKKPLEEALPEMLDPGDPRVVIRPFGNDWLCPYTGKRIEVPDWDGSSLTLLKVPEIREHLISQPELQKLSSEAQMKSFDDLVSITIFLRISAGGNYKISAGEGEWVCPYCMQKTEILLRNWDGSDADIKMFLPDVLKHFASCSAYQEDPINGAKTIEEIKDAGGDRAKIIRYMGTDARFRLFDADGNWLCPYSMRVVPKLNVKREAWQTLQGKILEYIMSDECPGKYSHFEVERSMDELKRAAAVKPPVLR